MRSTALIGLLALLSVAMLAGCGDGRAERAQDGRTPIRVFLLLISTQQVEFYRWVEEEYEAANSDVDVIIEQFPGSSLKDFEIKLRLRFSSGQAPDVFNVQENLVAEFVNLGLLADAPPYIEQIIQEQGRTELIREAPYYDGSAYGVVVDAVPTVLYYNKELFREAGLDPERPPRTWDELIEYADRLTVRDENGEVVRAGLSLRKRGFKPGTADKWLTFLFSAGGEAFNDAGTRALFNSPAGREALRFYQTILFDKNIDSIHLEGDQQGFGQGKAAMFIREVHVIRWLRENYPDLDFGVTTIPRRDTSLSSGGPYLWAVNESTPNEEEAWRFVEFMMSHDVRKRYCSMGGVIPVTESVAALPEYSEDPHLKVFLDQAMKRPDPFPRIGRATGILGAYIERFCYGRMDIDETLERAEHDVNALLRRNEPNVAERDAE